MITILLLLLLIMSFLVHIIILIIYVIKKTKKLFYGFFLTALSNIILGMAVSILILKNPGFVRDINIKLFLWLLSGIVMIILLGIKIFIVRRILGRRKDPQFYHMNYFGKKVYHLDMVKKFEYFTIFITIPFFLLLGAYFVARLINMYLYGHI